jgi:hypothetical protein
MAWTYEALKAADAELGIEDPVEAAVALSAQTVTTYVDVPTNLAREVVYVSGEWTLVRIKGKGATAATARTKDPSGAAQLLVDVLSTTTVLELSDPTKRATAEEVIDTLLLDGAISEATAATWRAMWVREVPVWDPAPSEHDIVHARSL